jgi:uncharacterized protein (DUF302 family)
MEFHLCWNSEILSNLMPQNATDIESVPSPWSVNLTVSKLKSFIESKGLTVFAHIDHGAGARQTGLQMQEAHVLIFGNAKAGTPLMIVRPLLALDLPLKTLIWEDVDKKVWVSFSTPEFFVARHGVPPDLLKNISGVAQLVKTALV